MKIHFMPQKTEATVTVSAVARSKNGIASVSWKWKDGVKADAVVGVGNGVMMAYIIRKLSPFAEFPWTLANKIIGSGGRLIFMDDTGNPCFVRCRKASVLAQADGLNVSVRESTKAKAEKALASAVISAVGVSITTAEFEAWIQAGKPVDYTETPATAAGGMAPDVSYLSAPDGSCPVVLPTRAKRTRTPARNGDDVELLSETKDRDASVKGKKNRG